MKATPQLDRADRFGMYLSIVVVAVGAILAIAPTVDRLIEVGDGTNVPVTVPLTDEVATLPLGPDGAEVGVTVDTATVVVGDPAPATLFALYAEPIWDALTVLTGAAFAVMLFLRLARGRAFQRGTSRLIYFGTGVLLVAWFIGAMLTNMTTNGAISAVSDYTYENSVIYETTLLPLFVFIVIGAFAAAFQIGEKLQRDTEGLV
ncbi:hypothetical protein [Demequina flava]|uniref:hypothetical protein n=1 Tax=Demequina flava TaxID=1095025 RepID=UPI0007825839|nr:hypothetical protein [Demequina flava]